MHPLSLECLTAEDATPLELVGVASDLGVGLVSVMCHPQGPRLDPGLRESDQKRQELRELCGGLGVRIDTCESFRLTPSTAVSDFEASIAAAADLGAASITVVPQDDDRARVISRFVRVHQAVAQAGLKTFVEFTPRMSLKTLPQAVEFLQDLQLGDVQITVDALHLFRSGGSPQDIRRAGALVGRAQLCDGPSTAPEDGGYEAMSQRAFPGDGELPLVDFIRALPDGIVVGVECPSARLAAAGVSVAERAARAVDGARRVIARAERQ